VTVFPAALYPQGDRKSKGCVELQPDTIVEENMQMGKPFCFSVITKTRTFVFQCKDKPAMETWMTSIAHNVAGLASIS
jgi:hypothetical protein